MTTRDGVGFHKNNLAEFDVVCFVCPLLPCQPDSKFCPWNILERLQRIEKRAGGDWARVVEMLQGGKGNETTR
jgi:hypothetical protein